MEPCEQETPLNTEPDRATPRPSPWSRPSPALSASPSPSARAGSTASRTPGGPSSPVSPGGGAVGGSNARGAPEGSSDTAARGRRAPALLVLVAAIVLVVDQVTKVLAVDTLEGRGRIELLGDWFGLVLVYNPGASFGMAADYTWVLTLLGVAVAVGIVVFARRLTSRAWAVAGGLILGGVVGNLVDRFVRDPGALHGHVVDFLAYADWFVGNVADIAIVGGAVLSAVLSFAGPEPVGDRREEVQRSEKGEGVRG